MNARAEVVVVGLGAMGSATLACLARRGVKALGVERHVRAHDHGSSHGESRLIRKAYFEHPDYVPLLERSYALWREVQAGTRGTVFHEGVGLVTCSPAGGVNAAIRRTAAAHGLPIEEVDPADVRRRWPGLRAPEGFDVLWDAEGGILRPEACIRALLAEAERAGATVWEETVTLGYSRTAEGLAVATSRGGIACDRIVVTAGPWAPEFLAALGLPLVPRRKVLFWHRPRDPGRFALARCPAFLYDLPYGQVYGFPDLGTGVKVADHAGGQDLVVPEPLRALQPGDGDSCARLVAECLPDLDPAPIRHATCLYTMTPDGHFVVDTLPSDPAVVYAAGFSGHGFKFAPVIGEVLADLATSGRTDHPVAFLGAARLRPPG